MIRPRNLFFTLIFIVMFLLTLCFWLSRRGLTSTQNEPIPIPANRPTSTSMPLKRTVSQIQSEIDRILIAKPIKFLNDGYILDGSGSLKKIVNLLKEIDESIVIRVSAHADINGTSDSYNRKLTQHRADMVAQYIKKGGIKFVNGIGYGREFLDKNSTFKSYTKISIIRIKDDF